jgi:hypothetical protein
MTHSDLYPRAEAQELDLNISLQPSNRLLYIGLGIVLIGIIVLLAISIAEGPEDQSALPPRTAPSQSAASGAPSRPPVQPAPEPSVATLQPGVVKPEAFPREPAQAGSDATQAGHRESIRLHVVTAPPGAEVSLSGKLLGATPLDTETERRRGTEVLTIHRPRYQDITATIDLSTDYTQTVTLTPIPEPPPRPPADHTARPPPHERTVTHDGGKHTPTGAAAGLPREGGAAKNEDCQPPDKINPYELACHGHVCKPCPTTP